MPPAEPRPQLVALLPWRFITGSLIPGIRSLMWIMRYIKNHRSLSRGYMCEPGVFICNCGSSLHAVFVRHLYSLDKSHVSINQNRGGGILEGWDGGWVWRFLWLQVPVSQSVKQPRGKEWLEQLKMMWHTRRRPRGAKRQPNWWYQSFHSALAWTSSCPTTQFAPVSLPCAWTFFVCYRRWQVHLTFKGVFGNQFMSESWFLSFAILDHL